jgi:DNA-binding ferritin-like protein (Dps family)
MRNLTTPIIETNTANQVQITGFVDNREEGRVEIHYMLLLEDGTPYKRNIVQVSGDDIAAFYASIGVDFESQVKEQLYLKVMENI